MDMESELYEYDNVDIGNQELIGLLAKLLKRQSSQDLLPISESGCPPGELFVEYIYEHDIHNQVFNSSLQVWNSDTVKTLQSSITDWAAEEIYERNLATDITDQVRLIRLSDVSNEYNDNPTVRYYVSLAVQKSLIPAVRRILSLVFDKLQREYFATSNNDNNLSNMISIPTQ